MKTKIFLRFGHDILSNGKCTAATGILKEFDVIRDYGQELEKLLKQNFELQVFNSLKGQYKNSSEALYAGIKEANNWRADIFISCHANKYNSLVCGTEVLYQDNNAFSKKMASKISKNVSIAMGITNRGAKGKLNDYAELRETKMSAIIIEPFFIDNKEDCSQYIKLGATNLAHIIYESVLK